MLCKTCKQLGEFYPGNQSTCKPCLKLRRQKEHERNLIMKYCKNCGELPESEFYPNRYGPCKKCVINQVSGRALRMKLEVMEPERKPYVRAGYVEPLTFAGVMDSYFRTPLKSFSWRAA